MTNKKWAGHQRLTEHKTKLINLTALLFLAITVGLMGFASQAHAQSYRFNSVKVEGNKRIEQGTILNYAGIGRGQTVDAGALNSAYQRILGSGLFESVELQPRGGQLRIIVVERPTINRISIEGNKRLKDKELEGFIQSKPRLVFSPTVAERDAATLTEAYSQNGRLAARVTPKIIRRSDNRVDLIFEVFEGGNVEIERVSVVGNQQFSDHRLRRVLDSKQAGLLRLFVKKDTLVEDRIEFDKQLLRDFYLSRGYVDFRTTEVNAELARERDGYFVTFNVQEGQQFRFGAITTVSDLTEVDADEFQSILKVKPGVVYSPTLVENSIARLERLAIKKGLNFVRVEPRVSRNDRDLTLDVEFVLSRGPRIFVERIDIEGNATTQDQVIRRQFKVVEGDPFNPREIRESAERVRALGHFSKADVNARQGSSPDKVVVDVDVEETTTGSLSFGGTYSTNGGIGLAINFSETNFLGRGQSFDLVVSGTDANRNYSLGFAEPAFLGRDLRFDFSLGYRETENDFALYNTSTGRFSTGLTFPVSDNGRLGVRYTLNATEITTDDAAAIGGIVNAEIGQGRVYNSTLGYRYSYDTRRTGLNPNAGVLLEFGQDFGGVGGDNQFIKTTAKALAQTRILNEEVTLRATLEGGALNYSRGGSRVTERFLGGQSMMRGFTPDGIGPRERAGGGGGVNDALGGNFFAVAKFEAIFPLGLPEEYGLRGGVFYDVGAVWGLGDTSAATNPVLYEDFSTRQVIGLSLFWKTPVGPLRFNWTKALDKREFDEEQTFNLTISTEF